MKKVLKKVLLIYGDLFMVSVLIWLLSLRKLDKRIDRDIEAGEIEELAINDPLIRWMANIDNCILIN